VRDGVRRRRRGGRRMSRGRRGQLERLARLIGQGGRGDRGGVAGRGRPRAAETPDGGNREPRGGGDQDTSRHESDRYGSCVRQTHVTPYQCCSLLLRNDSFSMDGPLRRDTSARSYRPSLLPGGVTATRRWVSYPLDCPDHCADRTFTANMLGRCGTQPWVDAGTTSAGGRLHLVRTVSLRAR
jgi:hypothetical protein